jgi:2-keto-4-pentenoate hydratase/2-oxohepta-3-ene-1,7-dioic acid hydratase in catechol pathway
MRYVTFEHRGVRRPGQLRGETVEPLLGCAGLLDFIDLSPAQRDDVLREAPIPLEQARLLAPLRPHKNVFCVGRNYLGHAEEIARARGTELKLPSVPTFFTKAPTSIADPGATLHLSAAVSSQYDWEAELAVVIGQRCKDVAESDALEVVFGYTCLNDVTARDLQREHQQWFKGKSLDDACPLGPWIVSADELPDPQKLEVSLRVNGVRKQHASTAQMIFTVAQIIASLSRGMTLEAGDIIATGTPDGVGFARTPPEFLKDGDVMEVEIGGIGVLRSEVMLSAAAYAPS